jgi:hypothetical protein
MVHSSSNHPTLAVRDADELARVELVVKHVYDLLRHARRRVGEQLRRGRQDQHAHAAPAVGHNIMLFRCFHDDPAEKVLGRKRNS